MFNKVRFESNDLKDLTPEQIEAAKKQFGKVYKIIVEDKSAIVHKPTRLILDNADKQGSKKNSAFNEVLLKSCWLAGDKELVNDDDYFFGASTQLSEIINFKEGEIKEL